MGNSIFDQTIAPLELRVNKIHDNKQPWNVGASSLGYLKAQSGTVITGQLSPMSEHPVLKVKAPKGQIKRVLAR